MAVLYHHGVKGMKWGVRKNKYTARITRGHAGPGTYISKKRQLEGAKRDLKTLDEGGHLSVGLTKKRQKSLDARDRAALEKKIAKLDRKKTEKAAADALDKLDDYLFFNGDNIPNNFAVRAGIRSVANGLRNGDGIYNATLDGLSDYKFFKD